MCSMYHIYSKSYLLLNLWRSFISLTLKFKLIAGNDDIALYVWGHACYNNHIVYNEKLDPAFCWVMHCAVAGASIDLKSTLTPRSKNALSLVISCRHAVIRIKNLRPTLCQKLSHCIGWILNHVEKWMKFLMTWSLPGRCTFVFSPVYIEMMLNPHWNVCRY